MQSTRVDLAPAAWRGPGPRLARARGLLHGRAQRVLRPWVVRSHAQAAAPQAAPEASRVAAPAPPASQPASGGRKPQQPQKEDPQAQHQQQQTDPQQQQQQQQQQEPWLPWLHAPAPTAAATTAAASVAGLASAAFFFAPLFGRGRKGAPTEPPADVAAAEAPREADAPAGRGVAQLPGAAAPLPLGWWQALPRVFCVSFGARHGLMPRLALDARRPAALSLVAFEDAADAHYAAGVLRDAHAGGPDAAPPPQVVSTSPLQLEGFAQLQGTGVEVLPRGRLRHGTRLGAEALAVLLQEALGYGPPPRTQPPRGAQPQAAAEAPPSLAAAAAPVAVEAAASPAPRTAPSEGSAAPAAPPPARGGFSPVATDLPELLRRSLGALPGGMASAAAAVAEAGAAPASAAAPTQPAEVAAAAEASERVPPAEAEPAGSAAESPGAATTQRQAASSDLHQQQQQQQQQEEEQQQRGPGYAEPAAASALDASSGESDADASSAERAVPQPRTFADAVRLVSPTFGRSAQEIQELRRGLLAEFYQLEGEWRGGGGGGEGGGEEDSGQQRQQERQQAGLAAGTNGGAGAASAAAAPANAVLGREVDRLEQRVDEFEQRRWEEAAASSGGPGGGGGLQGAAEGLAAVHSELWELQGRVGGQLAALNSVESLGAAGVVAPDGTIDRRAGLGFMAQLQDTLDGLKRLQRRMESVAEAAGVQLPPAAPRMADAVRQRLGVTPQDEARMAAEIESARAERAAGGFNWRSRDGPAGAGASSVVDVLAEEVAAAPNAASPMASSSAASSAATAAPANGAGAPGNPANGAAAGASGGSSSTSSSGSSSSGSGGGSGGGGSNRAWGSWPTTERMARSKATLLPKGSLSSGTGTVSTGGGSSGGPSPSTGSGGAPPPGRSTSAEPQPQPQPTGDGATIVSKRVGSSRPPRTPTDPRQRQDNVREALRAVSAEYDGTTAPAGPQPSGAAPDDPDATPPELLGGDAAGGLRPWWVRRYEALYLPTLGYADGSVGFVQVDVSPRPGVKDVRVLTFADRHDCMHCLTVMREWPETAGCALTMGAMPTATLERDIRTAWLEQRAAAAAARWGGTGQPAGPQPAGPSPPSGVLVFRRGKLPMRTGMAQEEFMQGLMYQAVAQRALGGIGYDFDD